VAVNDVGEVRMDKSSKHWKNQKIRETLLYCISRDLNFKKEFKKCCIRFSFYKEKSGCHMKNN
jgi:hypothetical protein